MAFVRVERKSVEPCNNWAEMTWRLLQEHSELTSRYEELLENTRQLKLQRQSLKCQLKGYLAERRQAGTKKFRASKNKNLYGLYPCLYNGCSKLYSTETSLNVHMRRKHMAGTKTEREYLARKIILAEARGDKLDSDVIHFPPGYLKELKQQICVSQPTS